MHKKVEEENRRQAGKGKPDPGGRNPGRSPGKGTPRGGQRSLDAPTAGRGLPNAATKGEQQGEKRAVPTSSPAAGGAKKGENANKRKLNRHGRCLQAAAVGMNFPEEGYEGDLVFLITVKIGDRVYKTVLDGAATRSLVARILLKEGKIRKTETVAIRVTDGQTIHSLGGGSMRLFVWALKK